MIFNHLLIIVFDLARATSYDGTSYTAEGVLSSTNGVVLKLLGTGEPKFLGIGDGNLMLPVNYERAMRFNLSNTQDQSKVIFKDSTSNKAITQKAGPDPNYNYFRRMYTFMPVDGGWKQGFRLVYHGPNDFVIMHNAFCIGMENSQFRSKYCDDAVVSHFAICISKNECHQPFDLMMKLHKDVKEIKNLLSDVLKNHWMYDPQVEYVTERSAGGRHRYLPYDWRERTGLYPRHEYGARVTEFDPECERRSVNGFTGVLEY